MSEFKIMNIVTPEVFAAYLKCPTKCWLTATSSISEDNNFGDWMVAENETYRRIQTARLLADLRHDGYQILEGPISIDKLFGEVEKLRPENKCFASQVVLEVFESHARHSTSTRKPVSPTKHQVEAINSVATQVGALPESPQSLALELTIPWIECTRPKNRGGILHYIPSRFNFAEKISADDRMSLGFDAVALAKSLSKPIPIGKILHGKALNSMRINTEALATRVKNTLRSINVILRNESPPDLILNSHCSECKYRPRCRLLAEQSEDLSLLSSMTATERAQLHKRGLFTVTQLSYTFRPRRRSSERKNNPERHQHSLKALAIREGKTHVVGHPELQIENTEVYLDVEGLPDQGFYYLVGMLVVTDGSIAAYSFWADNAAEERLIWTKLCEILEKTTQPTLIHYGSYESIFIKRMQTRYGSVKQSHPNIANVFDNAINLLAVIYTTVYFPTYSNGLKDIAKYIGYKWSDPNASGLMSIVWRYKWDKSKSFNLKRKLIEYNLDDCSALMALTGHLKDLFSHLEHRDAVQADRLLPTNRGIFKINHFQLPELEYINRAAYWDYQHERILVKSPRIKRKTSREKSRVRSVPKTNRVVHLPGPLACVKCHQNKTYRHRAGSKTVIDLRFGEGSIKRWVTIYHFYYYRCPSCRTVFRTPDNKEIRERYGKSLRYFCVYQNIELRISQGRIAAFLSQMFSVPLSRAQVHHFKTAVANFYIPTYHALQASIKNGKLVHADETQVNIGGKIGYVWVFTNLAEVVYLYASSREGELVKQFLKGFKGVLVTDFYTAYDSLDCPKQKCLIHLIRDLNEELYKAPFNTEYKQLVAEFTMLLKPIIDTIDHFGLKARFLRKHKGPVMKFFKRLAASDFHTEVAKKCKLRLERNRSTLFTFLDNDNVPWNNNNAEHAVKAFVLLRKNFEGLSTEKSIKDYLVLLSICETCRIRGLSFFDFLSSGVTDMPPCVGKHERAESTPFCVSLEAVTNPHQPAIEE